MAEVASLRTATASPGSAWRTRLRHLDPSLLVWIALALVLIFLVVNPLLRLVVTSFTAQSTGEFTVANYLTAYGRQRYLTAVWNSLELGAAVSVLCLVFAVPIAWGIARTNMPAKGAIRLLALGAFITPPYLGAVAWMLLAGPNS